MGKKKKNKQKAAGNGAVDDGAPTHLAGVRLPDELREIAAAANQFVRHPIVGEVISAGVLAAIAALAENESVRRAARHAGDEAEDVADGAARTASRAKVAVKAAAGAMGKRLLDEVNSAAGRKSRKGGKSARQGANGGEPAAAR
jgi:hypothetical protein